MNYKIGDFIELDCGYGPQENMLKCIILDICPSFTVFKQPIWDIYVVDPSGAKFHTDLPRDPAKYIKYKKDLHSFFSHVNEVINPWRVKNDLEPLSSDEAMQCFEILTKAHE